MDVLAHPQVKWLCTAFEEKIDNLSTLRDGKIFYRIIEKLMPNEDRSSLTNDLSGVLSFLEKYFKTSFDEYSSVLNSANTDIESLTPLLLRVANLILHEALNGDDSQKYITHILSLDASSQKILMNIVETMMKEFDNDDDDEEEEEDDSHECESQQENQAPCLPAKLMMSPLPDSKKRNRALLSPTGATPLGKSGQIRSQQPTRSNLEESVEISMLRQEISDLKAEQKLLKSRNEQLSRDLRKQPTNSVQFGPSAQSRASLALPRMSIAPPVFTTPGNAPIAPKSNSNDFEKQYMKLKAEFDSLNVKNASLSSELRSLQNLPSQLELEKTKVLKLTEELESLKPIVARSERLEKENQQYQRKIAHYGSISDSLKASEATSSELSTRVALLESETAKIPDLKQKISNLSEQLASEKVKTADLEAQLSVTLNDANRLRSAMSLSIDDNLFEVQKKSIITSTEVEDLTRVNIQFDNLNVAGTDNPISLEFNPDLNSRLSALEAERDALKAKIEENCAIQSTEIYQQLEDEKLRAISFQRGLLKLRTEMAELERTKEELVQQLAAVTAAKVQKIQELEAANSTITSLKAEIEYEYAAKRALEDDARVKRAELLQQRAHIEKQARETENALNEELEKVRSDCAREIEKLRSHSAQQLAEARSQAQTDLLEATTAVERDAEERLRALKVSAENATESVRVRAKDAEAALLDAQKVIEDRNKTISSLEKQLALSQNTIMQLNMRVEEYSEECERLKMICNELEAEFDLEKQEMMMKNSEFIREQASVQAELETKLLISRQQAESATERATIAERLLHERELGLDGGNEFEGKMKMYDEFLENEKAQTELTSKQLQAALTWMSNLGFVTPQCIFDGEVPELDESTAAEKSLKGRRSLVASDEKEGSQASSLGVLLVKARSEAASARIALERMQIEKEELDFARRKALLEVEKEVAAHAVTSSKITTSELRQQRVLEALTLAGLELQTDENGDVFVVQNIDAAGEGEMYFEDQVGGEVFIESSDDNSLRISQLHQS